jgi:hypothetical protein
VAHYGTPDSEFPLVLVLDFHPCYYSTFDVSVGRNRRLASLKMSTTTATPRICINIDGGCASGSRRWEFRGDGWREEIARVPNTDDWTNASGSAPHVTWSGKWNGITVPESLSVMDSRIS